MPVTNFSVSVTIKGRDAFDRMAAKLMTFAPAFDAVLERWLAHNEDKFAQSKGAESVGISFSGDATWEGLTPGYMKAKRRGGFEDWLMVRTGETKAALTQRGAFGQFDTIEPMAAHFTLSDEPRQRAQWNIRTRPLLFLDEQDQQMIREMFAAYLNDDPPFRSWKPSEVKRMDAEFGSVLNPLGGA